MLNLADLITVLFIGFILGFLTGAGVALVYVGG